MFKRFRIIGGVGFLAIFFTFSCIDLEPNTSASPIETNHTITATVLGDGSVPLEDVLVTFEIISGPNMGRVSIPDSGECTPIDCTSDAIGEVRWTYSSKSVGTDFIVGSFLDLDGIPIESEPVEQMWIAQIPTISEWGFVALAAALGIIGILAVRRRKIAV